MRRKFKNPAIFDPDDLSYYVWDHLNTAVRLKRLGLNFSSKSSQNTDRVYRRDLPLARGYGDGKSPQPTSFCRLTVHEPPTGTTSLNRGFGNFTLHIYFAFGWLRKTSSVYKTKHKLILTPDGDFHWDCSVGEHVDLEKFERDLTSLIKKLTEHAFEDIEELFDFMGHWINGRHAPDRLDYATTMTHKLRILRVKKVLAEPVKLERPHKYRMGRVNVPRFRAGMRR